MHYIKNIQSITEVGFKYFDFHTPRALTLRLRGLGNVRVLVVLDRTEEIGCADAVLAGDWQELTVPINAVMGVHALYFIFDCSNAQFESFEFVR